MAALTLIEASKTLANNGKVFDSAIVQMFAESNAVMKNLPFKSILGTAYSYNQEAQLPAVGFRGINEEFDSSVGAVNPEVEALRLAGGDIDVDRFIVDNDIDGTTRAQQESMKSKALANDFLIKFFKGDSSADHNGIDGLQVRLINNQLIDNTTGGSPLSLAKLDEAIDAVYDPNVIFMSKKLRRYLLQAARTATGVANGAVDLVKDPTTGKVLAMYYNGIKVEAVESADGTDSVLPFSEASPDGASSVCTSVYVCHLEQGYLMGIQNKGGMKITDMGRIQGGNVYRTKIDWDISVCLEHGRAAARLRGITDGAIVA